jgi:transposase InsO family protein
VKTLRNWERAAPRRPGRPPRSQEERDRAALLVEEALEQGRGTGIATITHALAGAVPERLVREVLPAIKLRARRRREGRLAACRVHVHVRARDALWSLDQTHVGRDRAHRACLARVVRDVATTRTIALAVGRAARGADVVALLERARVKRGCAPLALAIDNGPENVNADVDAWCAVHGVTLLRNLPHTPQHNAWIERGHRDLKEATGLGKGVVIGDLGRTERLLRDAAATIDENRLRPSRGWRTARALDAELPRGYAVVPRETFRAACARRKTDYLQSAPDGRAKRMAERRAVLDVLEDFELIHRTRGGAL